MRVFFFFQAEDGIRDLVRSRGLGDVYKRQVKTLVVAHDDLDLAVGDWKLDFAKGPKQHNGINLSLIHI